MATLVATQHNPVIRVYYRRLVESGKKKMVALIAAMRKLLVILNAILIGEPKWKISNEQVCTHHVAGHDAGGLLQQSIGIQFPT